MILRRISFPDYGWKSAFSDLERMRRDMDRLFEQVTGGAYRPLSAGVFPLINLTEDKDNYYV